MGRFYHDGIGCRPFCTDPLRCHLFDPGRDEIRGTLQRRDRFRRTRTPMGCRYARPYAMPAIPVGPRLRDRFFLRPFWRLYRLRGVEETGSTTWDADGDPGS